MVVAKSPAPSVVAAVAVSKGDQKKELAAWARWCSTLWV
jgi:hypothetical protein